MMSSPTLQPEESPSEQIRSGSTDINKYSKESRKEIFFRILAILIIILFPITLLICFRVVKQYKRAVIMRFGRIRKDSPAGPGIIWMIPCTDDIQMMDLRTQSFNLPPQEILTKDSVTVTVDAVVYFHIQKPLHCLLNIQNNQYATELITVATLRNILGQHSLYNLLTRRESISFKCRTDIDKTTSRWGVVIERVEIKDVFLPFELQKAMAAEAEGTRVAKAKIIESEGEIKAAENLKEASK
ncbi:unnamed protein product [Spodoptera littoralis]|uniref:Band 7 domain-containing protein n=1 Tax=Spodoptera littoralis TaxID=7109 RepID=A0A9P0ICZ8_SPOLI|nr:unnamed protein product [Spodoptera littoralis]CAH1644473.1 unnamed protein product [Spodoptera littoralis]